MKVIKKKYILFFACIFISFHSQAQTPPVNFYTIKARMDAYYDSIKQINGQSALNEDESGYGQYQAWINYWEPLVFPSGNFSTPYNAINKIAQINSTRSGPSASVSSNWTELGPFIQPTESMSGQIGGTGVIHFIRIDPQNSNNLVAGSPAGGLFYSTNGGDDWHNANTDQFPCLGVSDCVIDPHNSGNWFLATGDRTAIDAGVPPLYDNNSGWHTSTGIYRKMGTEFNWQRVASESDLGASDGLGGILPGWQIKKLIFDPSDLTSNTLWAATSFGIYKTTNALATTPTWSHLHNTGGTNSNNNNYPINDIEFIGSTIYATRDLLNNGIFSTANIIRSIDGGITWPDFDSGIALAGVERIEIETSPVNNPNMLYAMTIKITGSTNAVFYTINT